MTNILTFAGSAFLALVLLIAILLTGPDLLLPATFMIVTVFVGWLCIYVVSGILSSRSKAVKDWEARHPE
ncbi:hypothetical protein [Emcibacter sp.]|uniref:hypothetical protein n=1 Tax=Emcibacter sp. TaxID=1979954 RepID=UPI002AA7A48D|nr:hypothetical protein [Emcibacter sp.]